MAGINNPAAFFSLKVVPLTPATALLKGAASFPFEATAVAGEAAS